MRLHLVYYRAISTTYFKNMREYYLQQMGIEVWQERKNAKKYLHDLAKDAAQCVKCPLHMSRTQTVFGGGNSEADLLIIGEAPGLYEDELGLAFAGKAGDLLDKMLQSIGLCRDEVYIANIIKCMPPDSRDPTTLEIEECSSYLKQQIAAVAPKLIVSLGRLAGQFILSKKLTLNAMRQTVHYYEEIPCVISYHPEYLLRNPRDKSFAYSDLLRIKKFLVASAADCVKA